MARYALDVNDGLSGQFYVWVFGRGPDGDQNSVWLRATGGELVALHLDDDDDWTWKRASRPTARRSRRHHCHPRLPSGCPSLRQPPRSARRATRHNRPRTSTRVTNYARF
jgi:hypothetical protein